MAAGCYVAWELSERMANKQNFTNDPAVGQSGDGAGAAAAV
jgi:hypothetical protein